MNLIHDPWVRVQQNGPNLSIAPWQLTQPLRNNNVISDIVSNRPDFKGAIYQLLIGLLQTITPPKTEREWYQKWSSPPNPEKLKEQFAPTAYAFEFSSNTPAFLQDYDLPKGQVKPISTMFIEAPGGKTLKDNLDHFIKRGSINAICRRCAALALFTLQTNAPPGGVGHRVGLRGGGPLTTLLDLDETFGQRNRLPRTLWHKLWLNVLPLEFLEKKLGADEYNWDTSDPALIFPWLGPTPTSEKNAGRATLSGDVHPFHMFWGMPRRIRIDFEHLKSGQCDICGDTHQKLIQQYITKNYGINYDGTWKHPLTPYYRKKQKDNPLPLHGQKGGISYQHWLGLTLGDRDTNQQPAITLDHFFDHRLRRIKAGRHARIWAFGFDMDNMKARCWYEARMPLYDMEAEIREQVKDLVLMFVDAAAEVASNLRQEVRNARYKRPKDVKGDWSFVDIEFWQATEQDFYGALQDSIHALRGNENIKSICKRFHGELRSKALAHFDRYTLGGSIADLELFRIVKARRNLSLWMNTGKKVKELLGYCGGQNG